jgi:hypothetical protein
MIGNTMAAAATSKKPARTLEDEVDNLSVDTAQLSPTARLAVCAVLNAFLVEGTLDHAQARRAQALRDALGTDPTLTQAA